MSIPACIRQGEAPCLHPRRRTYACGRTRFDVAALDEATNYEMASRNCISTNFVAFLRSRQHSTRRYGWNGARVWCTHVWRTGVWWTRVTRLSWLWRTRVWWTRVTRVTRLSRLWPTRVWWTRVTRVTRLSWLSWTRVRWTHGWCKAAPLAGSATFSFAPRIFLPALSSADERPFSFATVVASSN
jgi:hypothetical protein